MKAFYLILGRTQERLFDWIYENIHRKTSWHWSFKGIVSSQAYLHVVNLKCQCIHVCIPRDLGMGKFPPPLIAWHLTARLLTHNHLFANQTKCQKVIMQLGKLSSDFFIYTSPSNLMIARRSFDLLQKAKTWGWGNSVQGRLSFASPLLPFSWCCFHFTSTDRPWQATVLHRVFSTTNENTIDRQHLRP